MATGEHAVLTSWKEIAAYLSKGVRTVQRWEHELNLPVHRPVEHNHRIVLALSDELDIWVRRQMPSNVMPDLAARRAQMARLRALMAKLRETSHELAQRTKALLKAQVPSR